VAEYTMPARHFFECDRCLVKKERGLDGTTKHLHHLAVHHAPYDEIGPGGRGSNDRRKSVCDSCWDSFERWYESRRPKPGQLSIAEEAGALSMAAGGELSEVDP
jgi:hypothetical protein